MLTDAHATSADVEAAVEMLGVKPVSDGIVLDDDDTLYVNALPAPHLWRWHTLHRVFHVSRTRPRCRCIVACCIA